MGSNPVQRRRRGSSRWLTTPSGACLTILTMTSRALDSKVILTSQIPVRIVLTVSFVTVSGDSAFRRCEFQQLGSPASTEGVEVDDELLPGDNEPFQPSREVEQALRTLESGGQLPLQPVRLRTGRRSCTMPSFMLCCLALSSSILSTCLSLVCCCSVGVQKPRRSRFAMIVSKLAV
jgi:hypothetical protein